MRTYGHNRAARAVCNAVKAGDLTPITKNTKCVDCGEQAKYYDHRDYNKPLDVEPVCNKCNQKRGRAIPWNGVRKKPVYTKPRKYDTSKKKHEAPVNIYWDSSYKRWRVCKTINGDTYHSTGFHSVKEAQSHLADLVKSGFFGSVS